jgi:hypothetical protein
MTRRPRSGRPPRLDAAIDRTARPEPIGPPEGAGSASSLTRALTDRRVAGTHARLGRAEVQAVLTRLAAGHVDATLGLDLGRVTREEASAALEGVWGTSGEDARIAIDPAKTVAAVAAASQRLRAVARAGGRVAFATGRPASLLALHAGLAAALAPTEARVVDVGAFGPVAGGRSLWWVGSVGAITDGESLLADDASVCGGEWLFAVGRPELVVADRGFAAAAVGAGVETIAFADLDAVVLGVAARRQHPVLVVPVDERRPPGAYDPLLRALVAGLADAAGDGDETDSAPGSSGLGSSEPDPSGSDPSRSDPSRSDSSETAPTEATVPTLLARGPHSTTLASGAYAAPESGEEG